AIALVGLCAPDIASLGKLNGANGDKFVAGGYDMTEDNLAAIKGGHAYVTLGQSAFVQGYLPVALLVNATQAALQPKMAIDRSSPSSAAQPLPGRRLLQGRSTSAR